MISFDNPFSISHDCEDEFAVQDLSVQDDVEQVRQKIKTYIDSVEIYKTSVQSMNVDRSIVWLPEYDIIEEELKEIYGNIDNNYVDANEQFNSLEITNYASFKDFVINTNIKAKNHLKGNLARIKSIRSPRGDSLKCKCGGTYHLLGSEFVCDKCENRRSYDKKAPGNVHKQNMDKHIAKQIDVISGIKNLPSNIRTLKPYIIKWLVERKYLLEWLRYSNKLEKFMKSMNVSLEWFSEKVERIPENKYNYAEYVSIINEFYSMFETCNSLNNIRDSDMNALPDTLKIEICKRYFENFHRLPEKNEIFEKHQIGNYILKLFIIFDKNETEKEIEKIFCSEYISQESPVQSPESPEDETNEDDPEDENENEKDLKRTERFQHQMAEKVHELKELRIGGLMFNFVEIRRALSSPPKKFNLTSIYTEISHLVFNVQYIIIRPNDKIAIENIIKEFNKYYKNKQEETKSGKFNSPLFYCSLHCILTKLKYFEVYNKILNIIPDKYVNSKAMTLISGMFILFMNDNPELIEPYRNANTTAKFDEDVSEILNEI